MRHDASRPSSGWRSWSTHAAPNTGCPAKSSSSSIVKRRASVTVAPLVPRRKIDSNCRISCVMRCMAPVGRPSASRKTVKPLPEKGTRLKTSTCRYAKCVGDVVGAMLLSIAVYTLIACPDATPAAAQSDFALLPDVPLAHALDGGTQARHDLRRAGGHRLRERQLQIQATQELLHIQPSDQTLAVEECLRSGPLLGWLCQPRDPGADEWRRDEVALQHRDYRSGQTLILLQSKRVRCRCDHLD